ncbi:MAG: alpha/beta hydrolase [Nocardioides sp.]|nr:alpha/beta hydrolase [Nocardioides sp.]
MHRRMLLRLPALAAGGTVLAGCGVLDTPGAEGPVREPDGPGEGRTTYGADPSQFGDLYLPEGGAEGARGVVVVIHGGFWQSTYGLDLGEPLATSLTAAGWVAWNLEYRRVGNGGGTPETFDDVAAGIDTLRDLGLPDSVLERVVTLGHSAGGHLAAWAAGRLRDDRWAGGVPVTHVVSQAGVLDLVLASRQNLGGGAVASLLGHPAELGDDAAWDPAQQVPLDVPVWAVHGVDDPIVPLSQSESYVEQARAAGATAEVVEVPGDHFVNLDTGSEAWARTLEVLDSIG